MKDKKTIAIIAIVILIATFGAVAAFAKTTTTVKKDPGSHEIGGVGDNILSAACAALGIKC